MVADAHDQVTVCPGCGGKNPPGTSECDWCGRAFISRGRRLRLTVWQLLSTLLIVAIVGAVGALAVVNAGRTLPVRASVATSTPAATTVPTPAVTPRVTAANAPTPTVAPRAPEAVGPTPPPPPTPVQEPTPAPTPTPQLQVARIVNTSGLGVSVRLKPGPQAPRAGVLREGTRVLLTGNDQTVAARPWREIETEDHNLKGWVLGDFLQMQALQSAP